MSSSEHMLAQALALLEEALTNSPDIQIRSGSGWMARAVELLAQAASGEHLQHDEPEPPTDSRWWQVYTLTLDRLLENPEKWRENTGTTFTAEGLDAVAAGQANLALASARRQAKNNSVANHGD